MSPSPMTGVSSRGDWWVLFNDPQLNELEEQLLTANPTLQAAAETYTQARALAAEAESESASANCGASPRARITGNLPIGSSARVQWPVGGLLESNRRGGILGAGFLGCYP